MSLAATPEESAMGRMFTVTHEIAKTAAWRALMSEARGLPGMAEFERKRFLSAEKWASYALVRRGELLRTRARATKAALGGSEHE